MPQVVIEDPVLNSPFLEPSRHFKFSENGITDEVIEARRVSSGSSVMFPTRATWFMLLPPSRLLRRLDVLTARVSGWR
jgi:hypothetical protein